MPARPKFMYHDVPRRDVRNILFRVNKYQRGEIAKLCPSGDTPVNPVCVIIESEERRPKRNLVYDCYVARRIRMRVERPFLKPRPPFSTTVAISYHLVSSRTPYICYILYLLYNKFFKYIDWLQNRNFFVFRNFQIIIFKKLVQ